VHRVEHEPVEFFLGIDVPVERHRADPEVAGDPPHADRFGPLGVGDGDGDIDDVGPAEPARPAPRRRTALGLPLVPLLAGPLGVLPLVESLMPAARPECRASVEQARRQEGPVGFLVLAHQCSSPAVLSAPSRPP
jgi:hypothetical protein